MKLGGKNKHKFRYGNDVTGTDLLYMEELGGGKGVTSEKLEKMRYF